MMGPGFAAHVMSDSIKRVLLKMTMTTVIIAVLGFLFWIVYRPITEAEELRTENRGLQAVDKLQQVYIDELEADNAKLCKDFCQEAKRLQECQLNLPSESVKSIDKIIGVHK
jgi:hypothetical protein